MKTDSKTGTLYVVATPIGNLEDISARAVRILGEVDLVLAEDTRVSALLLRHFGITKPLAQLHAHNEHRQTRHYLEMLAAGKSLAIISDAGTPLISDPGFILVRAAKEQRIAVSPVPGASALTAALSVSGLAAHRFTFEGFLPATATARRRTLEALRHEPRTMVFFEAPHRISTAIADLAAVFGAGRPACLARELTKFFETVISGSLGEIADRIAADADQRRGEMVICVQGADSPLGDEGEGLHVAAILARYLSPSQAAAAASEITGARRKDIYKRLLADTEGADTNDA